MSLRDYQETCLEAISNFARYGSRHGYVVLPTGSGKSHLISSVSEKLGGRVLVLAHRKELLAQNHSKFSKPHEVGIYSTGLNSWDLSKRITIAGIQSIINNPPEIPPDWILVDECHRISNNTERGRYWRLAAKYPHARIIGFTATPYRLGEGRLSWGEELFSIGYKPLIKKGYLSPLCNKAKEVTINAEINNLGDYVLAEAAKAMLEPELLKASIDNLLTYSYDRKKVMVFTTTVAHGMVIRDALIDLGHNAVLVHGKTDPDERAMVIRYFKEGRFKYIINCELFTEGFDEPAIDMIAVFRPTKSKALHMQILGRGCRIHPDKENCLVLDMAGNLREHGGLDEPYHGKSTKQKDQKKGRICPACESFIDSATATECPDCGYVWIKEDTAAIKHDYTPDTESNIYNKEGSIKRYEVKDVTYFEHQSRNGNTTIKVIYSHDYDVTKEYLSPYSESEWARGRAWDFFNKRGLRIKGDIKDIPMNDLLLACTGLRRPVAITVAPDPKDPKYTRITDYEFSDEPTQEAETIQETENYLEDEIPF